ncbi:flagellar assembly protein FliW [Caryophanon tenue]|uniref:Flagellar assembly factor FliW n=1 Tax=Caryophanon tenue TaxID=33978 RepID=A0A1C0YJS1_9BACL|nr:flagellar assembly protein FliW [Caryophanon tenue]OCS87426.1 flagellar assembly protein FliW [Caryophanon tenue]
MKIQTKFLGEITITQDDIFTFEAGIPGFSDAKQFVLLPIESDITLATLQCVTNPAIGFIVAYPFAFKTDYAFDLADNDKEELQLEVEEDALVYSIITLKETFESSTMNLLAPIVLNKQTKRGKQLVLQQSERYPLRHPIGTLEGSAK